MVTGGHMVDNMSEEKTEAVSVLKKLPCIAVAMKQIDLKSVY